MTGMADTPSRRTAVIGSGVSGLTSAYLLRSRDRVTLYEADSRLGGHAHTHALTSVDGEPLGIDSGFIVHNERTYPNLLRLFAELDIPRQPTVMSMSISVADEGLEYAGGSGAGGIFAQRRNLLRPRFVRMLTQVKRFHRLAERFLATSDDSDLTMYGDWLAAHGFSDDFVRWYAMPLVACVWSSGSQTSMRYPARSLFTFLERHGMLTVTGSPQWYTVSGGSQTYVRAVEAALIRAGATIKVGAAVTGVARPVSGGVVITDESGSQESFDRVVIATHGDQALRMLEDPSPVEREVLGGFHYSINHAVLHTDDSLLPRSERARASWNYRVPGRDVDAPPVVTYWMNQLHDLPKEERPYLVTLNGGDLIDPSKVIAEMDYTHPIYDGPALRAQRRLGELTSSTTAYAGAHHGWGFHEDGCRSGVEAAAAFGAGWGVDP